MRVSLPSFRVHPGKFRQLVPEPGELPLGVMAGIGAADRGRLFQRNLIFEMGDQRWRETLEVHNNAAARGSFVGLSHLSDQARLAQAVMEGVAFAFRDCQRVLKDAGTSFGRLLAVGGGSRSALWLKLIATNLDTEIALPEDGDFGGALGAARLGLCAAEGADPAAVMAMPGIKQIISPDASLRDAYTAQYARYRALYPAIEEARQ